jgi:hypothetical protein
MLQRQQVTIDTSLGPQEYTVVAQPGPDQAQAFQLLGQAIPDKISLRKPRR